MLRKIRITLEILMFVLINLLFLSVAWGLVTYISWVAKIQFLPALLALNFGVIISLLLITLIFGRIYCSVICPLGITQDIFGFLGKKTKKNHYSHSKEKRWLRYGVLAVFIICLIIGFAPITTLLAPYSAYGRIVNSLFRPLYDLLNNAFATIESNYDSYIFQSVDIWMRSVSTFVIALLTLCLIGVLAWRNGRTYCNTICPVGTILSFVSRFSLLRIQMDKEHCKNCSLCEKNCKASAIDYQTGKIDYSRCVACGDCIAKCKFNALHYRPIALHSSATKTTSKQPDTGRRAFLTSTAMVVGASAIAQTKMKVDGGLAVVEEKQIPERQTVITPPGSISARHMNRHCTACQLCVSACPNNVLRPSTHPHSLMQPTASYERGWCRPECTRCSEVCPTGAIKRINKEEKTAIHIGHAVWIEQNCIPITSDDSCGNCAKRCPAWAIQMVEYTRADGKIVQIPAIDTTRCIGCGACEQLCPARPFSAIYVEGNEIHHIG